MLKQIIHFEDNGQDFLQFIVEDDIVVEAKPFQTDIWKGAYIPVYNVNVGEPCPIHHPPHINYGYLKHNVEKIETIEN